MKTNLMKLSFLMMSMLLTANQQTLAAGGTAVDGGGGMSYQGGLLDFAEAKQGSARTPFVPMAWFKDHPSEVFTDLNQKLTAIESHGSYWNVDSSHQRLRALNEVLTSFLNGNVKKFYFTVQPISAPGVEESNLNYLIKLDKKSKPVVVAYQNNDSILVNKSWFESATDLDRVGLIYHEFGIYLAMKFKQPHENARELTRAFFADQLGGTFNALQVPSVMIDLGFGEILNERSDAYIAKLMPALNQLMRNYDARYLASQKWLLNKSETQRDEELRRETFELQLRVTNSMHDRRYWDSEFVSGRLFSCFEEIVYRELEYPHTEDKTENLDQVHRDCRAQYVRDLEMISKFKVYSK